MKFYQNFSFYGNEIVYAFSVAEKFVLILGTVSKTTKQTENKKDWKIDKQEQKKKQNNDPSRT